MKTKYDEVKIKYIQEAFLSLKGKTFESFPAATSAIQQACSVLDPKSEYSKNFLNGPEFEEAIRRLR